MDDDPQTAPTGECRFSVHYRTVVRPEPFEPTVADPDYHLRYWYSCACGDVGPLRSRENDSAEDGCDHAYPGWRDMPVMESRPYEGKPLARWEAAARVAYPPGWFDRGGPVREYRTPGGNRHVPGYAPGGGHCMAVMRMAREKTAPVAKPLQSSLF
ncbi:DUF6349 family protein [Streptosporangium lutulentum]|uniref:Uncharacterized protein n=1 Tax=Streptosporangium lutulentum TaxID=1461250 RepID=A0ABT9Q9A8_9ACTN|nr:DUF6349 family protein [Streptosporangium lutulentum]MDP9843332.1 hypothetical protein [Streptosporangium lutulentum]